MEGQLSISELNRRRNLAELEKRKIRDSLELDADESDSFKEVFERFTNMEKIIFVHLEYGLSSEFIKKHLGITRQRYSQIVGDIRKKIMEEQWYTKIQRGE